MIAVFGNRQEPCSPVKRRRREASSAQDSELLNGVFDLLAESLPRRHRAEVEEHLTGACAGIAYVQSPSQSFASSGGAAAFLKGAHQGLAGASAAEALLKEYECDPWDADAGSEEPKALRKLCTLGKTPYAFILHDSARGLIFAARDPKGMEQMFWGSDADGNLLFSSDQSLLERSCADADLFPAGALFISDVDSTAGRIIDIIPIAPEEEEEGEDDSQLCASASRSDLLGGMGSRVASQSQIAAQ